MFFLPINTLFLQLFRLLWTHPHHQVPPPAATAVVLGVYDEKNEQNRQNSARNQMAGAVYPTVYSTMNELGEFRMSLRARPKSMTQVTSDTLGELEADLDGFWWQGTEFDLYLVWERSLTLVSNDERSW